MSDKPRIKRSKWTGSPDSVLETTPIRRKKVSSRGDKVPKHENEGDATAAHVLEHSTRRSKSKRPGASIPPKHSNCRCELPANVLEIEGEEPQETMRPGRQSFKTSLARDARLSPSEIVKNKNNTHTDRSRRRQPEPRSIPLKRFSFRPDAEERERILLVLARTALDPERQGLEERIGAEFIRAYSRYRRRFQRSYVVNPKEKKAAIRAGSLCLQREITPSQLITYWHEHVGDFTEMKFPPLSFLSSPGNVDRASCAVSVEDPKRFKRPKLPRQEAEAQRRVHSFSSASDLDARIRPGLEGAGFSTTHLNDKYLLTIQSAARTIASGKSMFVSSTMRPLVRWVAENIFGEGGQGEGARRC